MAQPAGPISGLWGWNGELFNPAGRLPDWSYAGYMAGEAELPTLVPTHNVRQFGAVGNGVADDTDAFLAAIKALSAIKGGGAVLHIPAGRYVIQQRLQISARISLLGDGPDASVLCFPKPLAEVYFPDGTPKPGQTFSFNTAFIDYRGSRFCDGRTKLTDVTAPAARGDNTLRVASTAGIVPGEWVSLTMASSVSGPRFTDMNMGVCPGCEDGFGCDECAYWFQSRVAAVSGDTVTLERPLPWDLYGNFRPWQLFRWAPKLSGVGVAGLSFVFKTRQYAGHFKEPGFNALEFSFVANSFIRDVKVMDSDLGINISRSTFITVQNVHLFATPGRPNPPNNGFTGHHGLNALFSTDVLFRDFSVQTRFVHDITVDKFARGIVWTNGYGVDLNMDHHRTQSYGCLFTQLHFGATRRPWASGGSTPRGLHAGSLTTYWGLLAGGPEGLKGLPPDFGPALNFVGLPEATPYPDGSSPCTRTWLVERVPPAVLQPPNIFFAQRALRLAQPYYVAPQMGGKGWGGKRLDAY